jgi:hypothetical protein
VTKLPADPAHDLYDSGCELLAAAHRLSACARRPDCGEAIPATLGCLGATLSELSASTDALAEELRRTRTLSDRPATATMQELDRLTEALTGAHVVCETARSKAAVAARDSAARFGSGLDPTTASWSVPFRRRTGRE